MAVQLLLYFYYDCSVVIVLLLWLFSCYCTFTMTVQLLLYFYNDCSVVIVWFVLQESQGRRYLSVVDLDASAVLKDMKERPEASEPQLDVSLTAEQRHLRNRIGELLILFSCLCSL